MGMNQQPTGYFCVFGKLKLPLFLLLLYTMSPYAIDYTWDISSISGTQTGSGTWGLNSYWSTDGITLISWPGTGNTATFAGVDGTYTITVSGTQSVDSISFLNNGYTLAGGTAIDLGTGNGIYVADAGSAFVATPVIGTGGLVKTGAGLLYIAGECTYTGTTVVNEGTLMLGTNGASGSVAGTIIVNDLLYFNRSDDFTFSGDISGTGSVYKWGAGSLTLTGALTNTGIIYNHDGNGLIIGNGAGSGSVTSDIENGLPLTFNRSDSVTYGGVISGTGAVTKSGTGKLVFTANHTYTGATTINEGILSVDGSIAAGSTVDVNSGGILAGTGSVLGDVTVNSGGSIEPAYDAFGRLTVASLQMASDGELRFDFGMENDTLVVSGDIVLDGLLTIYEQAGFTTGTYRLIEYTGTLTDNALEIGSAPAGYNYSIVASAGTVELTVSQNPAREWVGGGGNNIWSNPTNWSSSIVPVSTDSVVFMSASYPCSLDVDVTVRCLMLEPGFTQTFYMNNRKLEITGRLSINHSGDMISGGADTICFAGTDPMTFIPKPGTLLPTIHQTGDGATQVSNNGFRVENLIITNGGFNLGAGLNDTVVTRLTVSTGNLNVADAYLYVNGDADFSQALGITAGYGAIRFSGASQQILIPKSDLVLPNILKDGAGDLRVQGDRLRTSRLEVNTGTVVMDTALTIDTINVMSGSVFKFDSVSVNSDTIKTLEGYGEINFGQSDIHVDRSLSLNMFSTLTGTGNLIFFGDDTIDFEPNNFYKHNRVEKRGGGCLRIYMYGLSTRAAELYEGCWDWSTSGVDTVSDTLAIYGGVMKLSSSYVYAHTLTGSGGELFCNMGTLVSSGGGTFDLSSLTGVSADSGSIRFEGMGASRSFLSVNPSDSMPVIQIYGTTSDTVELLTDVNGKGITQYSGRIGFGTGLTHSFDTLRCYGGEADFGSATIYIAQGDLDLNGLSGITAGTGAIHFTASGLTQLLMPPSALSCPEIVLDGTGTVQLSSYPLSCNGLRINSGTLNFNGMNVTVDGDFSVGNGTASTFNGLDGVYVTVNGNSTLSGQNGNLLNLNPATAWSLTVSGSLYADYATIGYCDASGGTRGLATNTCVDGGGNTNWVFDTLPPDNDMGLTATGTSLTEVNVVWYPSLIDSTDADSIGVWYKTSGYPDSVNDVSAIAVGKYRLDDSIQTVLGLNEHTRYYFAAAVRDSAGNWSDVAGALDSAYTFAEPPSAVTYLDTIHKKVFTYSWNNPSGLSAGDSVYIHYDTVTGPGWLQDTALDYPVSSCDLTLPLSGEGRWKIMVSTSWDSAGVFHVEDVLVDTFTFEVSPPSITASMDTIHRQTAEITWDNPAGLEANDSIYLHIDTVAGGSWTLDMTLASSAVSAILDLPASEGIYRYMLSTSLDSAGEYSVENVYLDTILFLIEPPVITTGVDSVESVTPAISWTAPGGMAAGDSFYVTIDTITGVSGWNSAGVYAYPTTSAFLSFPGVGRYMYRITTSWDSLCSLSDDNGAYDTITIIDTTPPTGMTLQINDNSGHTADSDPAISLSISDADSMRIALAADTGSVGWVVANNVDSIDISGAGEGTVYIYAQFSDSLNNRSVWIVDSTIYDVTPPTGTLSINDNGGKTADADPLCTISASDADSMRLALLPDTSGSIWRLFSVNDSVTISDGGEGTKIIGVQFGDIAGNRTQWYMDTTMYDTTDPSGVMSITDVDGYTSDSIVQLVITANNTDSMRVGLGTDTSASPWKVFTATDSFVIDPTNGVTSYLRIQFADTSGKRSAWYTDSTTYDSEPPQANLTLVSGNYVSATWPDSIAGVSVDKGSGVESVMVTVKNGDDTTWWNGSAWQSGIYYNQKTTAGTWTISLPDERLKTGNYVIHVQAVDKCGNMSGVSDSVNVFFTAKDTTPPVYALTVSMVSQGDSIVTVTLNGGASESGGGMKVGTGFSETDAVGNMSVLAPGDTALTSGVLTGYGWWYVATAQSDTAGNWTDLKLDSIYLKNALPIILMADDTTINEEVSWSYLVTVYDRNGDSIEMSAVGKPDGLVFDGATVNWLPDDQDVGGTTLIIKADDGNGGITTDTMKITVNNKADAPVLTLRADSIVLEDQLFTAVLAIVDPDPGDTWVLTDLSVPEWMQRTDTVLRGTPTDANVGRDSIVIAVKDSYGLSDTIKQIVTVENVNDTPMVLTSTCPDTISEHDSFSFELTVRDDDADDTLIAIWTKPCLRLSAQIKRVDDGDAHWVVSVKGEPSRSDVGENSFILTLQDRDGAAVQFGDSFFIYDEDDPPEPPSIAKEVAWGAVRYTLRSVDDRDTVLLYAVTLTSLDDATRRFTDRSENATFTFFPLEDGIYRLSAVAMDNTGFVSDTAFDTLVIAGATRSVTYDSIWTMFSIPGSYEKERLTSTKYLLHWDETIEKKQLYHYYQQKHEITNLHPGYGYWRKGTSRDTIVLESSDIIEKPVTISLDNSAVGWNQIGCPFPYPVAWNDNNAVIWKWNTVTGDFEESDSILEPWQAYWIHTDSEKDVVADTVPCFRDGHLAKRKKTWFSGKSNWVLRMILNSSSGRDAENRIGIRPEARDGYDRYDRPEPPHMFNKAYMFIPHNDWKKGISEYAVDIRKKWEPINIFEVGINGAEKPEIAKITFEGYQRDASVYLFMKTADSIVQVDPDEGIAVRIENKPVFQTLFVVDNPQVLKTLPLRFSLGNPYPNPFCPATKIKYILPYRWEKNGKLIGDAYVVRMDIFDMRGRKIRNIIHRKMAPGSYEAFWDGKSGSGRIVASGHYFCRLQAGKFESVRKMTLLR